MKFYIGVTDDDWFHYLKNRKPDEVNFWRPGGLTKFQALDKGEPLLFKLHSPNNYIAGLGFYVDHSVLPVSLAWQAFQEKNGYPDFTSFKNRIIQYRRKQNPQDQGTDPMIGCTALAQPIFFEPKHYLEMPSDWPKSGIMTGKGYNTSTEIGFTYWQRLNDIIQLYSNVPLPDSEDPVALYQKAWTNVRIGQGAFRLSVTNAYEKRCAITGEKTLPVLEAAHIQSYSEGGPNSIQNGLLLRVDLHRLFDTGYLTVTKDYHVEVSNRINEEYHNGKIYYAMHGEKLKSLPPAIYDQPSKQFIEWHNQNVYRP